MSGLTDGEKIVELQTEVKNLSTKVETNFTANNKRFDFVDQQLNSIRTLLTDKYLSREALLEKFSDYEKEIKTLRTELEAIKSSGNFWKWFAPTLSAFITFVFTSVFMFLLFEYLKSKP